MCLLLEVPPRLPGSRTDTEMAVNVEQRVHMECNPSHGLPEPRITWLKDGEPLEFHRTRNIRLLRGERILQMLSADVADSGIYTCQAENKAGQDQRRYMLYVHGASSSSLCVSYSDLLFTIFSYS